MMEIAFLWLALGCYVLSSIAYIGGFAFLKDRLRRAGTLLAVVGLLFHTVSLGQRWVETGHGPYISTYEILSSTAWMAVLFFLAFEWRFKIFEHLGSVVMPLVLIVMGFALFGSIEAKALPPSLRSTWLVIHVIFAKITVSAHLVATAMSGFYLVKRRRGEEGFLQRLPSMAVLDDWSYRLLAVGFIALTVMIVTGAIWANNAWGSYWSWDPTQTWSLVVWFVYGIHLHGRITFRWQGVISAWYIIIAFVFVVTAFFVIPYYIKSIHSKYMVG